MAIFLELNGVALNLGPRVMILVPGPGPVQPDPEDVELPDAMAPPTLVAGDGQISASQPTPPDLNNGTLAGYDVRYATSEEGPWTEALSVNFPLVVAVTNGVTYFFQQRANNELGPGPWSVSATEAGVASATAPPKPATPTLTIGNAQLSVDLPENSPNGGSPITSENVRHSADGVSGWTVITGATDPQLISGLTNGQDRYVQYQTVNAVGASPWSDSAIGRPTASTAPVAPPADDEAANFTELVSILNSYKNNWSGTIPVGKTATSMRYIDVANIVVDNFEWKNYNFPALVHVRSKDRLGHGFKINNKAVITSCTNLELQWVEMQRTTLPAASLIGAIKFDKCNKCGIKYSVVSGPRDVVIGSGTNTDAKCAGIGLVGCTFSYIEGCYISDWAVGTTVRGGSDNYRKDIMYDWMKGDDAKANNSQRLVDEGIWYSLTKFGFAGGDHTDFDQDQTQVEDGVLPLPLLVGHRWQDCVCYQKTTQDRSFQGLFIGGNGTKKEIRADNCISIASNGCVKFKDLDPAKGIWSGNTGDASNGNTWCTALYPVPMSAYPAPLGVNGPATATSLPTEGALDPGGGSNSNNIQFRYDSVTLSPTDLKISAGVNKSNLTPETMLDYFTGPITRDPHETRSPLTELKPIEGTQAHWDHPDPKGAWRLCKTIYEDGHPFNHDYPNQKLVAIWKATWNKDGVAV